MFGVRTSDCPSLSGRSSPNTSIKVVKQVAPVSCVAGSTCDHTEEEFPAVVAQHVNTTGSSLVVGEVTWAVCAVAALVTHGGDCGLITGE